LYIKISEAMKMP